ncbi:hypothetical protein DFA_02106 [Cavenderia fasciculata]|uniref:Wiscott-Aldrich syndrome protein n=1 Tax=Cavenderia fasciculata TaxID=261658 RepID=F4PYQ3_CACFS|nr:uncharacterized protein DFA_02106 [Cavenderia fasciculata]EGG19319.1 hypothetical protein DFA_02106 [Cavenderia fasciculata]|eukprot:XP_004357590.1 hypothetical protein DFA_02106 [Cavenderia fasciculata]
MPATLNTLSEQERGQISFVHGNSCDVLATSVARLYEGKQGCWVYTNVIGACSVVVNRVERTIYIRIVDLCNKRTVFEQEIYKDFDYQKSRDFFHTFEGDNTVYGLSFVNVDEACQFQGQLQQQLSKKHSQVPSSSSSFASSSNLANVQQQSNNVNVTPSSSSNNYNQQQQQHAGGKEQYTFVAKEKPKKSRSGFFSKILHGGNEEKEKPMEISAPTGFKHESHIGWDADNGFDIRNIPEDWRKLFSSVGIKKRELKNPETAQFILSVIGESVAQQNAQKSTSASSAPPPPPPTMGVSKPPGIPPMSSIPLTPIRSSVAPPPPPPTSSVTPPRYQQQPPPSSSQQTYVYQSNQQPVTYSYDVDSSVPTQPFQQMSMQNTQNTSTPKMKPPVPISPLPPTPTQKMQQVPPTTTGHPHPPVPPRHFATPPKNTTSPPVAMTPPLRGSPPPPPSVTARGMSPATVVAVSDTLPLPPPPPPPMVAAKSIPTTSTTPPPPPPMVAPAQSAAQSSMPPMATSSTGGGRDDLLAAIRSGTALKKVDSSQPLPDLSNLGEKGNRSLHDTLFAAMEIRRKNMGEQEQEQPDEDSDDSDWEIDLLN